MLLDARPENLTDEENAKLWSEGAKRRAVGRICSTHPAQMLLGMRKGAEVICIAVALSTVGVSAAVLAQQQKPKFEVASVRPQTTPRTPTEVTGWIRLFPGGRLAGSHSTVISLVTYAYDLKEYQVIGPDWIRRTFYAVDARTSSDPPIDQVRLMLRSLLEERFAFAAHREQREMSYQALVLARKDGRPGPRLRPIEDKVCDGRPDIAALVREKLPTNEPPSRNRIAGACLELRDLAQQMSVMLGTLVIDKTGLGRGRWVFDAAHAPFPPTGVLPRLSVPPASEGGTTNGLRELPSYTDALNEQLGLKLEPTRGPVDVLVIDSVEEPTEN